MRFSNVWLRYDRRGPWVLQAVDVTLDGGQIAVVLGRNGAGKTTLLAAAAGLLRPERGRIIDRPIRVGWVPERFPANQPFTIGAYLVGMARAHGLTRGAAMEQVDLWAERLFLTRYLDANLVELSKGTAQKVGLIQALIPRPDLLVLDEPWEGLDGQARELIPDIVGEILAVGGSVLVSDHLGEITRLPGALRWHVDNARVDHYQAAGAEQARYVIEVSVAAPEVPAMVAELRQRGHDVLRVRTPRSTDTMPDAVDGRHAIPSQEVARYEAARHEIAAPEPAPKPPSMAEIPWHDATGNDRRGGEVARHGARPELAWPGWPGAPGEEPGPGPGPDEIGRLDGWDLRHR